MRAAGSWRLPRVPRVPPRRRTAVCHHPQPRCSMGLRRCRSQTVQPAAELLLWHFDGRLGLVKSVLLFKGGLTSLWLMRLLWLMCTSLTGTVSQRCVDAELLPNFIAPEELSHTGEVIYKVEKWLIQEKLISIILAMISISGSLL